MRENLTVAKLRQLLATLPDDALVGSPPMDDREFVPFTRATRLLVKRVEPTKQAPWVRYFTSSGKLARIPALGLDI